MNYIKKNYNFKKTAYVVGGLGLIGFETSKALSDSGANVIIIDVKNPNKKQKIKLNKYKIIFYKINYQNDDKFFSKDLNIIFKKFKNTDIFINCSYPKTNKWKHNIYF